MKHIQTQDKYDKSDRVGLDYVSRFLLDRLHPLRTTVHIEKIIQNKIHWYYAQQSRDIHRVHHRVSVVKELDFPCKRIGKRYYNCI